MKLSMKLSFLLATFAASGCAEHSKPTVEFPVEGSIRPHQRIAAMQASNGARDDGNLYATHFTDDALNSLGRAKLDAMLRDDESVRPLTVHMAATPDRAVLMRRIESVTAYLKDNGLSERQMRFESGLNDRSYHPAAPALANLRKMDNDNDAPAATGTPNVGAVDDGGAGADSMTVR